MTRAFAPERRALALTGTSGQVVTVYEVVKRACVPSFCDMRFRLRAATRHLRRMRDLARQRHFRRSHGLAPPYAGAPGDEVQRMAEAVGLTAVRATRKLSTA